MHTLMILVLVVLLSVAVQTSVATLGTMRPPAINQWSPQYSFKHTRSKWEQGCVVEVFQHTPAYYVFDEDGQPVIDPLTGTQEETLASVYNDFYRIHAV
jgi:hypothetical protein